MKTLENLLKYTLDKKDYQIKASQNSHFNEPLNDLTDYLEDVEDDSFVGENFNYLSNWHHWLFIDNFVNQSVIDLQKLNYATYLASNANSWEYFLGEVVTTFDDAPPLSTAVKHLGQLLYLGQFEKAKQFGELLLTMLYGKQYDGGLVYPTHPWFMLELFCRWQGTELEQAGTRYPDNLGVYQRALDNWDSTNIQLVSSIVDELSDFHIQQSDEDEQEGHLDENGDGYDLEFTSSNYFIFPIEILMWLAVRKQLGLPDYTASANNKLMQLTINQLPTTPIPWREDELVEKCKAKLKADNPDIKFPLS